MKEAGEMVFIRERKGGNDRMVYWVKPGASDVKPGMFVEIAGINFGK